MAYSGVGRASRIRNIEICDYCETKLHRTERHVKVLFRRKKTPPPGAKDLELYHERAEKYRVTDCFCPRCDNKFRVYGEYNTEGADEDENLKTWLTRTKDQGEWDSYIILEDKTITVNEQGVEEKLNPLR